MATEKRLIDANELKKKAEMRGHCIRPMVTGYHQCVTVRDIDNAPTVDAVEVVHGEWTIIEDDYCGLIGLECSHCEKTWWFDEESPIREYHYCPGCGADMRERKDND